MEKYIAVTKENREFLIKTFRTTKMAVWRALTGTENPPSGAAARRHPDDCLPCDGDDARCR